MEYYSLKFHISEENKIILMGVKEIKFHLSLKISNWKEEKYKIDGLKFNHGLKTSKWVQGLPNDKD